MKNILGSVILHRILVIFAVGLISRVLVNNMFDINVFKEYTDFVSLVYYGLMAFFTSYINNLPSISLNIFNIAVIRNSTKCFCEKLLLHDGKSFVGVNSTDCNKPTNPLVNNTVNTLRRPPAAVIGLYSKDGGQGMSGVDHNTKHSIGDKARCKILWYSFIHWTGKYSSYSEYISSFDPRYKISIIQEIKKRRG